jgi:hypothetical protein
MKWRRPVPFERLPSCALKTRINDDFIFWLETKQIRPCNFWRTLWQLTQEKYPRFLSLNF